MVCLNTQVYTDHALNHMSQRFQGVMKDISRLLKQVYNAQGPSSCRAAALRHGSRRPPVRHRPQKVLVIRNGWFSFRWTQIFDMGRIRRSHRPQGPPGNERRPGPFAPPRSTRWWPPSVAEAPAVVLRRIVETGLRHDPARQLHPGGRRRRARSGRPVRTRLRGLRHRLGRYRRQQRRCLISAPQKGWSASPCCALIALGERARARIEQTTSTSFACDLKNGCRSWKAFENGGHAYHATMPTDALAAMRDVMLETEAYGFARVCEEQQELGRRIRALLEAARFFRAWRRKASRRRAWWSATPPTRISSPGKEIPRRRVANRCRCAAAMRRRADFRTFPHRPVRSGKTARPERTVANLATALGFAGLTPAPSGAALLHEIEQGICREGREKR